MSSIKPDPSEKSSAGFLPINSREFIIFQFSAVTMLIVLGFFTYLFAHSFGINTRELRGVENFLSIFDVREEVSVPTWFATINLLMSSCLLFCAFVLYKNSGKSNNRYWLYLAILFLLLSVDEVAGLHNKPGFLSWYIRYLPEIFTEIFRYIGFTHEIFKSHAWLPYGILFVILVGAVLIRFLRSIEFRLALLLVLSGIVFVSGAIGFELVAAWMEFTEFAERGTFLRNMANLVEESLEMYSIAKDSSTRLAMWASRNSSSGRLSASVMPVKRRV